MSSGPRARAAVLFIALSTLGCGSRSGVETPERDSAIPSRDAGPVIEPDAGARPDAGEDLLPVVSVRVTVTIGGDSLGDTDLLRPTVSEAFLRVRAHDGTLVEIGLNQGETWAAGTTHSRDVEMGPLAWSDVEAVEIEHVAAGEDWNADNWTMDAIVIASTSEGGRTTERYAEVGMPVWHFQKNLNQVFEHRF